MEGLKSGEGRRPGGGLTKVGLKSGGDRRPDGSPVAIDNRRWSNEGWAEVWRQARWTVGGRVEVLRPGCGPTAVDGSSLVVVLELLKPQSSLQSLAKSPPHVENKGLFIDFMSDTLRKYREDPGQV
ncbi:hypothetical protein MA16_Dca015743 [Dendrobium catenatum]|uniref:Uncharacterized protein n=1 Tax=Dendrobium catenatum TaxID=906689 RepID=A0A2I0WHU6_9ASPA|nr:hypothetical protein MA16_Dca015743 [Dendrobium catenatum]